MLVALVLAALVLLAAVSGRTGLPGAVALGAVSVAWLLVNGSAEGPVLWRVAPDQRLTATDVAGIAGVGVAVWRAAQWFRRRETGTERGRG